MLLIKNKPDLSIENLKLIETLRNEAMCLKDCFTKFSFQAITFASFVLSGIAYLQYNSGIDNIQNNSKELIYFVHYAVIIVISVLLIVSRIGTYKYGNANRQLGYELHLERTLYLPDSPNGWQSYMRDIGWEEAMRAWRIVQSTVFKHLFYYKVIPNLLKREHRVEKKRWFEIETLLESETSYHGGAYLKNMLLVLYIFAIFSLAPLLFVFFKINEDHYIMVIIVMMILITYRFAKDRERRKLLESGFLSIHSCAIMWQAIVVAHYRTLEEINKQNNTGYNYYTNYLSIQAKDLADKIFYIHQWINDKTVNKKIRY